MEGLVNVSIGRRKSGKTTHTRELLSTKPRNMPVKAYDINREYLDLYPEEFIDFEIFLKECTELSNHFIIFEEATIFFDTKSNIKDMKNLLVRARHTGNIIVVNFHSFKSLPKGIFTLTNYVTVFKTLDTVKDVKDKMDDPRILNAYDHCRDSKNKYIRYTIDLYK